MITTQKRPRNSNSNSNGNGNKTVKRPAYMGSQNAQDNGYGTNTLEEEVSKFNINKSSYDIAYTNTLQALKAAETSLVTINSFCNTRPPNILAVDDHHRSCAAKVRNVKEMILNKFKDLDTSIYNQILSGGKRTKTRKSRKSRI